jgi:hypothetical protein
MLDPIEELRDQPASLQPVLTTAELAECACPDYCERDHDRD